MKTVAKVEDWETIGILIGVRDPKHMFYRIKQSSKNPEAQKEELFQIWCSTHPLASWTLLSQALRIAGESEGAKYIQQHFLKGEDYCILYFNS